MKENQGLHHDHFLASELTRIGERLDVLEKKMEALRTKRELPESPYPVLNSLHDAEEKIRIPDEAGLWTWLGKNAVLPRVAAVCFMLVVALLLRTATENSWVSPQLGTVLGLTYVALLLICGWWQYASSRNLAPVFSGCGLILLFSIIAESRFHFSVLPIWLGSVLLIAAAAAAVAVSLRYRAQLLLWMAVMGAVLVIFILDFPNIAFPAASVILLVGTIAAIKAARTDLSKGLRWPVLFTVFFLFSIWGFKLNHAVQNAVSAPALSSLPPSVFAVWYLPLLLGFSFLFAAIPTRRLFENSQLDAFDHILPLAGALLFLLGGNVVLVTWWKKSLLMGVSAALCAFFLLAVLCLKMNRRETEKRVSGFTSLAAASALLFFFSIPFLANNFLHAQSFLPLVFIAFLALSSRTGSGNMRLLAVFLAFPTMVSGIVSGVYAGQPTIGLSNWLAVLSASVAGMAAYFWCRRNPPPSNGFFFHIDTNDYSAVFFLAYGLLALYFFAALTLTSIADRLGIAATGLSCGKSILINSGAALLIVWGAMIRKSKEIATTGIVVAFIGGGKVFFSDLLQAHGLALVLSVSSFGALTALCSLVLGNWQKMCGGGGNVPADTSGSL